MTPTPITRPHSSALLNPAEGRLRTILSIRSCDCGIQGPENLILTLAEQLGQRGVRYVIINLWDGDPPTVALHEEALRRGLESYVLVTKGTFDMSLFPQLRAIIQRFQPDVIHTHGFKSEVAALVASRLTHARLIGFYYGRLALNTWWYQVEEMSSLLMFRFFDHVHANSHAQHDELRAWRLPAQRVDVVPSFVNTDQLRPPSPVERAAARQTLGIDLQRPVLTTLGRLSLNKGHTYMLQALTEIRRVIPDVLYLIVGDEGQAWRGEGGLRAVLERQVATERLADNVLFTGYYPDLLTVLHATDIIVSPSLREGMQVALLEAMATARPVVATATGGTPDAVQHGVSGLLVPPMDSSALTVAVLQLLQDQDTMRRMGEASRQYAEQHFDVRVVADQVVRRAEQVVAGD